MMGRGLTLANLFGFGGVGCMQLLSGWIMNKFDAASGIYPSIAYTTLFATVACLILIATLFYLKTADTDLLSPMGSVSSPQHPK